MARSVGRDSNDDPDGDREVYLLCRSFALAILDRLDVTSLDVLREELKSSSESALRQARMTLSKREPPVLTERVAPDGRSTTSTLANEGLPQPSPPPTRTHRLGTPAAAAPTTPPLDPTLRSISGLVPRGPDPVALVWRTEPHSLCSARDSDRPEARPRTWSSSSAVVEHSGRGFSAPSSADLNQWWEAVVVGMPPHWAARLSRGATFG
jgi:hypothetical protein